MKAGLPPWRPVSPVPVSSVWVVAALNFISTYILTVKDETPDRNGYFFEFVVVIVWLASIFRSSFSRG